MFVPLKKNINIDSEYSLKRKLFLGLKPAVSKGMEINSDAVLASGETSDEIVSIDLSRELGVKEQDASKTMLCLHGEMVKKGDKIAQRRKGLVGKDKFIYAQKSGVIDLTNIELGIVKLVSPAKENTIYSGVRGKVQRIIKDDEVVILTKVQRVIPFQIYGNKDVQGEIVFFEKGLARSDIRANLRGCVIAVNSLSSPELLRELVLKGIAGLIVSSIDLSNLPLKQLSGLTVCVLDGLGDLQFQPMVAELLKLNDGCLCVIDKTSNELILTSEQGMTLIQPQSSDFKLLVPGDTVEVLAFDNWGSYGEVQEIRQNSAIVKLFKKDTIVEVSDLNILACL